MDANRARARRDTRRRLPAVRGGLLLASACLVVLAGCRSPMPAMPHPAGPHPAPLQLEQPLRDRIFPLHARLMERAANEFVHDGQLQAHGRAQRARLEAAIGRCAGVAACYVEAMRWNEAQRQAAADALARQCRALASPCARLMRQVRADGAMMRFHALDDAAMLAEAWMLEAAVADRVLQVYGLGTAPRYAAIDSLGSDPRSARFGQQVHEAVQDILASDPGRRPPHADLVQFALALLQIDGRDEAARYEPLHRGANRTAHRHLQRIDWQTYPYTAILVPGLGPETADVRLSDGARQRLRSAVSRYREGVAPVLIVSGGHVHPARTPFCEAVEMKRVLMDEFGIPEQAILIEPHARHTTTNLRNAARLLFRHGVPMQRPLLVVTDERQATYILTDGFDARNLAETGVLPYRDKRSVSATELSVVPHVAALQVGFEDPLDP